MYQFNMLSMWKLWASGFILSIKFLAPIYAAPAIDLSNFWSNPQLSCATTNCLTTSLGCELNDISCICTTVSFITKVATCLGQKCPSDVSTDYIIYKTNCESYGGYSLAVDMTQFIVNSGTLSSYLNTMFWNTYAECPRNGCLVPLTIASGCEIDDNFCVCSNSTLITQMAECIGKTCTSSDVTGVYNRYSSNCALIGGYSIALSESQWLSAAEVGTETETGSTSSTSGVGISPATGVAISSPYLMFWATYAECPRNGCLVPLTIASGCEIDDNFCVCSNSTLITQMAECIGKTCTSSDVTGVYNQYSSNCALIGGYSIALSESQWLSAAEAGTETETGSTSSTSGIGISLVTGVATSSFSSIVISITPASTASSIVISITPASTTSSIVISITPASTASSTEYSATSTSTSTASTSTTTASGGSGGGGLSENQTIEIGVGLGMGLPPIIISIIVFVIKLRKDKDA